MKLALIILTVGMLCIAGVSMVGINSVEEDNKKEIYSGPVPMGYNLEHFRITGETICEAKK